MLQKQFERLRQAEHRVAGYNEGGHLLATVVDQLALVGRGIGRGDRRRAVVRARRHVVVGGGHQLQRIGVVHHLQRVEQAEAVRRQVRQALGHPGTHRRRHAVGRRRLRRTQRMRHLHHVAGERAGRVMAQRRTHRRRAAIVVVA